MTARILNEETEHEAWFIELLAKERDKRTQVRWGVRDFEFRFGRPPEGMWLPETAVDVEITIEHEKAEVRVPVGE